jgi:uncharacterized protein with HEPN domain
LDPVGTARDRIQRAEKRGFINDAQSFVDIRLLRNEIAHEYLPTELQRIFRDVIQATPMVLDCVEAVLEFCERYEVNYYGLKPID